MRAVVVIEYQGPDDPDAVPRIVAALHDRGVYDLIVGLQARPVVHVAIADAADRVIEVFKSKEDA
jgi:hypothetical protein